MNWDDLKILMATAEGGGPLAAAQLLGVNQSTITRRIQQLEAALGTPLFERYRSGYGLTQSGQAVLEMARRIESDVTNVARQLAEQQKNPQGDLRVTTNDSILMHLLTCHVATFIKRFPEIRVHVILSNDSLNLAKQDADVAIRATSAAPENLVGKRVARIGWSLYGRKEDFDAKQAHDDTLFSERNWVTFGNELTNLQASRVVAARVAPNRITYVVNSVEGLAEAIEAGLGIGYLPCMVASARPSLCRLGPVEPALGSDLWLLTHPAVRRSPKVRAFADVVVSELAKQRLLIEGGESAGRSTRITQA